MSDSSSADSSITVPSKRLKTFRRRWSPDPYAATRNTAVYYKHSTSSASHSGLIDFEQMFTYGFGKNQVEKNLKPYLENLQQNGDHYTEEQWRSFLKHELKSSPYKVKDTSTTFIPEYQTINIPGLSSTTKPDITIADGHNNYIVHIEVLSNNNWSATIRKTYIVLLLQLIYIRSQNAEVNEVSGFVLSTKGNRAVQATVKWKARNFHFTGTHKLVTNILSDLPTVANNQEKYFLDTGASTTGASTTGASTTGASTTGDSTTGDSTTSASYFCDALTPKDVAVHLDQHNLKDGKLIRCLSVVLQCNDKVYKKPMSKAADRQLLLFKSKPQLVQTLIPEDLVNDSFFVFKYLEPLKTDDFDFVAESVTAALEELHSAGYAHLDVRLANIRLGENSGRPIAVLIDLDTSLEWRNDAIIPYNYTSIMYDAEFPDLRQYDWRQLAIMLARILTDDGDDYHHTHPTFTEDVCGIELQNCFEHGSKPDLNKLKRRRT